MFWLVFICCWILFFGGLLLLLALLALWKIVLEGLLVLLALRTFSAVHRRRATLWRG